jgi:hypothetical protein
LLQFISKVIDKDFHYTEMGYNRTEAEHNSWQLSGRVTTPALAQDHTNSFLQQHFTSLLARTHARHLIYKRIHKRGIEYDYTLVLHFLVVWLYFLGSRRGPIYSLEALVADAKQNG